MSSIQRVLSSSYQGFAQFREAFLDLILGKSVLRASDIETCDGCSRQVLKVSQCLYRLNDGECIDVFDLVIAEDCTLSRARFGIRRFVKAQMARHQTQGALVVCHYENPDCREWCVSFCQNNAPVLKFCSFELRPGVINRPAIERLSHLAALVASRRAGNLEIHDLAEAFSEKSLLERFFKAFRGQFEKLSEYLMHSQGKSAVCGESDGALPCEPLDGAEARWNCMRSGLKWFMMRLLGLSILQQKGWLGEAEGAQHWGLGDPLFLQHLYDQADSIQKQNFLNDVLNPLFARMNSASASSAFELGGHSVGGIRALGNVGRFWGNDENALNCRFPEAFFREGDGTDGDSGGLLDFFSHYPYTMMENTPEDAVIGIGPEMLERIFESQIECPKTHGVFYTPKEIVHYMSKESLIAYLARTDEKNVSHYRQFVEHAVFPGVLKKKCAEILYRLGNVRILDPAVGSGAFPIGMLKVLIRCCNTIRDEMGAHCDLNAELDEIQHKLIKNAVYGVDIDAQAIEIARLRMWFLYHADLNAPEAAEGLDCHIVQGDSLLDWGGCCGQTAGRSGRLADIWGKDCFDIVIGNPPYYNVSTIRHRSYRDLLAERYEEIFSSKIDISCLFYRKGIELLNETGCLCFVTTNKWLRAGYGEKIRKYLLENANPAKLIDMSGFKVFGRADVDISIMLIHKTGRRKPLMYCDVCGSCRPVKTFHAFLQKYDLSAFVEERSVSESFEGKGAWGGQSALDRSIGQKIEAMGIPLKDSKWGIRINYGIKTGCKEAYLIDEDRRNEILKQCRTADERERTQALIRPILKGMDIKRNSCHWSGLYVINVHNGAKKAGIKPIDIEAYPAVKRHLERHLNALSMRSDQGNSPFHLRSCSYLEDFDRTKIVYPETTQGAYFYIDKAGYYVDKTAFIMVCEDEERLAFIQRMLSSRLFEYVFRHLYSTCKLGSKGYQHNKRALCEVPVPVDESFMKRLCAADECEVDEAIYDYYRLSPKERLSIGAETKRE